MSEPMVRVSPGADRDPWFETPNGQWLIPLDIWDEYQEAVETLDALDLKLMQVGRGAKP